MKKLLAKEYQEEYFDDLLNQVIHLKDNDFAIITDNSDDASKVYIKQKVNLANKLGLLPHVISLQEYGNNSQSKKDKLIQLISELNEKKVPMIIQLPLKDIDKELEYQIVNQIDPVLDIDGLTFINQGKNLLGINSLKSCTAKGIIDLMKFYDIDLQNKNVLIVGRSALIGKPLIGMLLSENANVTVVHSKTSKKNLLEFMQKSDIVILQTGKSKGYSINCFKDNAVVIDAGISFDKQGKLCGDFNSEGVDSTNISYTPVPGGVGPMTVFELMRNVVLSHQIIEGKSNEE